MDYLPAIACAFALTLIAIFLLCRFAYRIELLDKPDNHRKIHQQSVPLVGGIGIFVSVSIGAFLFLPKDSDFFIWLTAAGLLGAAGVLDDMKALSVKIRLLVQVGVSVFLVWATGIHIESLGNLFGLGEINLGAFSLLFTVIAIVGVINAFNMLDGIDGLAGGVTLITLLLLLLLIDGQNQADILFLSILCASICAFLLFNLGVFSKKNKVFLGDAGSMMLGLAVVWLLIKISQGEMPATSLSPAAALWVIALPLLDMWSVMGWRLLRRKSPFKPGRDHLHHQLLNIALTPRLVLMNMLLLASLLGLIAYAFEKSSFSEAGIFYIFVALLLFYIGLVRSNVLFDRFHVLMPSRQSRSLELGDSPR